MIWKKNCLKRHPRRCSYVLRAALEGMDVLLPETAMALGGVETVVSKLLMKKAGQLELAKTEAEARIQEMAEKIEG